MKKRDLNLLTSLETLYCKPPLFLQSEFKCSRLTVEEESKKILRSLSSSSELEILILRNYTFNSLLWCLEDRARDTKSTDSEIAGIKRAIDYLNQKRNNSIEIINNYLCKKVFTDINSMGILISETPGSLIDRISILILRQFSLEKFINENSNDHEAIEKLSQVRSQIKDMGNAMENIIENIEQKKWYFKLYLNNKLYNNPKYNSNIKLDERKNLA
ncbi:MAG: hypothetical protein UR14_C0010G0011 [candidate division TM6 bacterium GW2011_GWE2_31_21]|nr:MAG: hypothetical protein UR14_C0010G0011 [candidate division TM6 bacterium GW2011_GWE2_31_21]KKQ21642.1 MAG: hypothetical protein US37_C0010G0003 [Candidatus Moranbacteria bacterium GW2011_GWF2_37_11]